MTTTIITLSTAALVAAAPAVLAQGVAGKAPGLQLKVSQQHHCGVCGYLASREMQARGSNNGYPGAFGYAPAAPVGLDRDLEMLRQAVAEVACEPSRCTIRRYPSCPIS